MRKIGWLALLWFLWATVVAETPPLVTAIVFEGNRVTRESILRQELLLHEGEPVDEQAIERSRQAIMNLGLFKSVQTELRTEPEGRILAFVVEEKFYVLPLPRLDVKDDGTVDYGFEVRMDNLFGLNQRLKLLQHRIDEPDRDSVRDESLLSYGYPRVRGSHYNIGFRHSLSRESVEVDGGDTARYELRAWHSNFRLSHWLEERYGGHGLLLGLEWQESRRDYSWQSGTQGLYADSKARGLGLTLDYLAVDEQPFRRTGYRYGVYYTFGLPELGSDYHYRRIVFDWRQYLPLDPVRPQNLNYRLRLGLADGDLFGEPAFSLGGGSLRGYPNDYVSGDAFLLANLEYHHPMRSYPQLKGALFADVGNAYPEADAVDAGDLLTGLGFGLRWKLQSFVDMDLNLDFAYGIHSDDVLIHASTHNRF